MSTKKPLPAQTEKKASPPKAKPSPKKKPQATKPKASKTPAPPSKWRIAQVASVEDVEPKQAANTAPPVEGRALLVLPQPAPATPWQQWKSQLPQSFIAFCSYIEDGGNLKQYAVDKGFPRQTLQTWIALDPINSGTYTRACEVRTHDIFDTLTCISDEATTTLTIDGREIVMPLDAVAVARNKLRVETRKWALSRILPKVYGDKVAIESTVTLQAISDAELLGKLAGLGVVLSRVGTVNQEASDDA